jgi:ADP-heptose:LPS heptosyltransferase
MNTQLTRCYQLGRSLRASGYEWSIVLPNSFKSSLVPFWARILQRTGYVGELRFAVLNVYGGPLCYLDCLKKPALLRCTRSGLTRHEQPRGGHMRLLRTAMAFRWRLFRPPRMFAKGV